ncbi:hexosaminidase [Saccharicrinis carchari]|uniref:beta-N-acetylhexosaminidase n=1 Tax=Saccharicrinis carchari TaxID=1168039 RepID=A0A521AJY8_SACCC|nr:family 20 glycosylhydrolase [Saccharicrinis carchari]SMO35081.1 hexosaminidase [Saccharicrinis carchari]
MTQKQVWMILCLWAGLMATQATAQSTADYQVVPLPQEINEEQGQPFLLTTKTVIAYPDGGAQMAQNAAFLSEYIHEQTGMELKTKAKDGKNAIVLRINADNEKPEGYTIKVDNQGVLITGGSAAGVFYGIQTLRKSLPVQPVASVKLPAVSIQDAPRFGYRGMMLDVARHMFSVDEIKTYIDMLALHNINNFHWHLSEDQGWRIEIKKYPRLTEIGSQRKETVIGRNSGVYDGQPYGGFYTQEEIKDVVEYARKRYINVIPEIDMPGHMLAALAAYPELGCTGGPYEVWTQWGISDDVLCVGNDNTLNFVKDVLNEVMDLFPSEFIHIGGDECPKARWKECDKCQARIKEHGLEADEAHSAEERLQSYFISYAEKVVNDRGRRMIGWDEILEGGLAPNATVMSWRGMSGGIQAAQMGHDVVMTPNSHVYFDHYQSTDVARDPLAIGGYSPLSNVYNFEPVPAKLKPEQQKHILGAQANLWTEYVPVFSHAQFMVLPRMAALCEVQWMQPENKDYDAFLGRLLNLIEIYKTQGYNYAKHIYDIEASYTPNAKDETIDVHLKALTNSPIYYTVDGTAPVKHSPVYKDVLKINKDASISARTYFDDGASRVLRENIVFSQATTKPIEALQPVDKQYSFKGISTLVDGLQGNDNYRTGRWIAFRRNDLEAVIDMKRPSSIKEASINTNVVKGDWIFDVREFSVQVSDDGIAYRTVATRSYPSLSQNDADGIKTHTLKFEPVQARYVKVIAVPEKEMPAWHGGKGHPAYLFVDEIVLK